MVCLYPHPLSLIFLSTHLFVSSFRLYFVAHVSLPVLGSVWTPVTDEKVFSPQAETAVERSRVVFVVRLSLIRIVQLAWFELNLFNLVC